MVLTAVCPKCRHEFPPQSPPPSPAQALAPAPLPATTTATTPSVAPCRPCPCGGGAPAAWLPPGHSPPGHSPPGQPPGPVPPPAQSPTSAMLSLSITASSAASLNGGHVVVNTMPSVATSAPSISVTATLPAVANLWPWAQPSTAPTWAVIPPPAAATWTTPSLPLWAAAPPPQPSAAAWTAPPAPVTLGLGLFPQAPPAPRPPQPAFALKGAQYRLTGGGILHERGPGQGPCQPHDASGPVLLQPHQHPHPRTKPNACGSLAPEQSPSTPLSFVLPGGALAPEAVPLPAPVADCSGTPEADLRLLQATTQALKSSGWYYEGFSWQESAATLRSAAPGTFLVRDSSDPRFLFSLSVQTDRGPTSVRLLYIAGGFRLDAEPHLAPTMPLFPCVLQLVEHYVAHRGKRGSSVAPAPAHANAPRGGGNREQVWVDARGQMYSHILLTAPRRHTVPGLQHLARLAVHRQLRTAATASASSASSQARSERISNLELPTTLCRYLEEYPYTL